MKRSVPLSRGTPLQRRTRLRARSADPPTHREVLPADEQVRRRGQVAAAQGWRCANPHCRTVKPPFEFDHVTPRSQGGGDAQIIMLCRSCHQAKTEHRLEIRAVINRDGTQGYAFEDNRPRPGARW